MKDVLIFFLKFLITVVGSHEIEKSCYTPSGKFGECKPLKACESLNSLILRGNLTQEEIMFLRSSQCDYTQGNRNPWVCCSSEIKTTTKKPRSFTRRSNHRNHVKKNIELPQPDDGVCGRQYRNIHNRIHDGEETLLGEFPWMALLIYEKPNKKYAFGCGGSLITSKHVVSAAHCVIKKLLPPSWILVKTRLGEWDRSTNPDCQEINKILECAHRTVDIKIAMEFPHESYDSSDPNKAHDIAILKLETNVKFNSFIKPICLYVNNDMDFGTLTIIGFGKTESDRPAERLMKAEIDIVNHENCERQYNMQGRKILDSQICARGDTSDSCNGDSGGPLMKQSSTYPSYWNLEGITSYGPLRCGNPEFPGVYTRVETYINWIKLKILI